MSALGFRGHLHLNLTSLVLDKLGFRNYHAISKYHLVHQVQVLPFNGEDGSRFDGRRRNRFQRDGLRIRQFCLRGDIALGRFQHHVSYLGILRDGNTDFRLTDHLDISNLAAPRDHDPGYFIHPAPQETEFTAAGYRARAKDIQFNASRVLFGIKIIDRIA